MRGNGRKRPCVTCKTSARRLGREDDGDVVEEEESEEESEEEEEPGLEIWFNEEGTGETPKIDALRADASANVVTMQFTMKF